MADYQTKANTNGHGESWALMCSEKTENAADDASWDATWAGLAATRDSQNNVATCVANALYHIIKAQGETK